MVERGDQDSAKKREKMESDTYVKRRREEKEDGSAQMMYMGDK